MPPRFEGETVESRCDAVAVGRTYLLPSLSSGGALLARPWLRFHIPLIEPDWRISRIRLSDKTGLLALRTVASGAGRLGTPVAGLGAGRLFFRSAAAPACCRPWGWRGTPGACGPAEGGSIGGGGGRNYIVLY
jgi:hypothetical protein